MKTLITLDKLKKLIDSSKSQLRSTLPLTNPLHVAYGSMTKGELIIEHLMEHWNASDDDERT